MRSKRLALAASLGLAIVATTALLWACGPWLTELRTTVKVHPASPERFERGELGIVRPTYARLHLLQAYRVLSSGRPWRLAAQSEPPDSRPFVTTTAGAWSHASTQVLGGQPSWSINGYRSVPGEPYQWFPNCIEDAFATAVRTLDDRQSRFGEGSAALRDWTRAQVAVFANCSGSELVLPEPAPAAAGPLVRADRAYQTAAAYFYAMGYMEAARRFGEIAGDGSSPWRPYGRYLAGRALTRKALLKAADVSERDALLLRAREEFQASLADPGASSLHASARGLVELVGARRRPLELLHQITSRLVGSAAVTDHDQEQYQWLMDRAIGDTVDYAYEQVADREAIREGDDANDWVLAFQGQGPEATARAIDRWRATGSLPWLVAVLRKAPPDDPVVDAALAAAAAVDPGSSGYLTVQWLRVRLLVLRGDRDEARGVLASLPTATGDGVDAETLNLIRAERFLLAENLEELLAHAPRTSLVDEPLPVLDADAGAAFTHDLPLARLVEAAASPTLPAPIRARVASAALARAIVLDRADAGQQAAAVLRDLAPAALHADLDRYARAVDDEERRRAGLLLLLRTPGLHAHVAAPEDDQMRSIPVPGRDLDHVFRRNWWCPRDLHREPEWYTSPGTLATLLDLEQTPAVGFLAADEVAAAAAELERLQALGAGRDYLATEVLAWARDRPRDTEVPEALARVVEAGRWTVCDDRERSSALSREAFRTLHQLYPHSRWAKETKYWYASGY